MSDEPMGVLAVRLVSEHLEATGHSDAARAMFRVKQRHVLPLPDGMTHVWLYECRAYDVSLLSALTQSVAGAKSRALDDAYARVYPWCKGPFRFHFLPAAQTRERTG